MKNKVLIGVGVAAVLAASILFLMLRKPAVVPAETLLPKDTIYYCGSRSPLKIKAALSVIDLKGVLQESAGLTEAESQIISDWIGGLQGVHVGFRSFTLVPFVLDATVVLDGTFDRSLTDLLATDFQKRFQPKESYRDVAFQKALIPVRGTFSLEVYITAPVQGRTFVAFSRRSLTEAIDRMKDGGPSLADNPVFQEMISLKQMRKADFIQYIDTQAYLRMFYDWVKSVPRPQFTTLADLFWKELRLADYGSSIAGGQFHNGTSRSFLRIDTANPLYRQFQTKSPLAFPYVPSNSCQFSFCRLAEPSEAFRQLTDMTVRLKKGIFPVSNNRVMQPVEDFLGQLGLVAGGNPADAGQWLSGELGMWQAFSADPLKKPSFCFYIGIRDAARVEKAVESFHLKGKETNGITVASSGAIAWSIQPSYVLIANDPEYLRNSLSARETSLTDTPAFRKLLKELPRDYSALKYTNYEQGIPVQKSTKLPVAFKGVLDLFKGFQQMSVSRAEEGMLKSYSAQEFNPDPQAVRALLKRLFSAEWSQDDPSVKAEPPLSLSADEAYQKSVALLSDGRQIDAEELVEKAYLQYPEDVRLLFAQAVLERSRWSTGAAQHFFLQISQRFPDTVYSQASELATVLDRHESADSNLAELIRLSDANPDDVYLLWLSAIECREQKKGEPGKKQYEKLLSKFRVGPVLLHQTYANILSEILGDHEAALKHRYIAVSLEAKGWTLQGLANTLTYLKRYQEACAVWARTVQVSPHDSDYWGGWGWTLRMMARYEEALEKHKEACRLDPSSAYDIYNAGWCLEKLERYEEMLKFYQRAAALGYADAQVKLGYCYEKGQGVEKNMQEAAKWYRLAADQGNAAALHNLGRCYDDGKGVEKNLQQAAACFRKAVETNPDDEYNLNGYAWFLATCEDESLRNYPEAVRLAELSVAKEEQNFNLDTLAAAYEKTGQYAKAVEAQKRLIAFRKKKSPNKEIPAKVLSRLEKYEKLAAEQAAKAREQ